MFVRPSFYDDFRCKAGECTDSCCIGWEIDIDSDSLEKYNNVTGETGKKLRRNIESDGECTYFKLSEGDRCPFLDDNNLCELYIELGEDSLCDICSEHPRFYNDIGSVTEAGLGLCCERTCELLFDSDYNFELLSDGEADTDEDAKEYSSLRNKLFDIIRGGDGNIFNKMNIIADFAASLDGIENSFDFNGGLKSKIIERFIQTEAINDEWTQYINSLYENTANLPDVIFNEKDYEKLLMYLLYRHFPNAFYDCEFYSWVMFCCVSMYFIWLCDCYSFYLGGEFTAWDRILNVKRWSKQIEYSTENVDIIRDMF